MPTLAQWIEEMADAEPVEAVVLGKMGSGTDYRSDEVPGYNEQLRNKVVTWSEAEPFLRYEFDDGFGLPRCQCITAWTKSWVIFIVQYDGATSPTRVPRNPVEHEPEMPGG
jgi:hypothetical protein